MIRYINRVEPGFNRDEIIGTQAETVMLSGSRRAFREALDLVLSGAGIIEYEGDRPLWFGGVQIKKRYV